MRPATSFPRGDGTGSPAAAPLLQGLRVALRDERGVWALSAAASLSLAMLGALAGGLDVTAVGYARIRLWSALSVTARAAARCLGSPSESGVLSAAAVSTCVHEISAQVYQADLQAGITPSGTVSAQVVPSVLTAGTARTASSLPPRVNIEASAIVDLPFPLPGLARVTLDEAAVASLVSTPQGGSGTGTGA